MRRFLPFPRWAACSAVLVCQCLQAWGQTGSADADTATASAVDNKPSYIRLRRNDQQQPIALQTATTRFVSQRGADGLTVDLIGVVHIGDRKYYETFNEKFKQYDVLLYELVAPAGTIIPPGGREAADNPITMMQDMAQTMLGLASQTDHVDYTAGNFVHADMSPTEMAEAMKERGDNAMTFALSAAADLIRQANLRAKQLAAEQARSDAPPMAPVDLITMLTDSAAGSKLKVQMAEQFGAMGSTDMALGATINQAIVRDRNAAAMRVLQKQVAQGHRKIGIFYGAAHMPDFETRLTRDFGLRRKSTQWQTAWDLTIETKTESPLEMMFKLLDS